MTEPVETPPPGQVPQEQPAPPPPPDMFADAASAESLVREAQRMRVEFQYGDDRAIGNPPNWPSYSSRELYEGAVNNNDPGSAEELGAQWSAQGKDLREAADMLYQAIGELAGAWVGQASGAAQGALVAVANASNTTGDAARSMGQRMRDQALAAAEVKKMPPPKEFDVDRSLAAGLAGGPAAMAADMKKQSDEARAVQQEQQRYMIAYTKSMTKVDSRTPSFAPESIGLKPVSQDASGGGSRTHIRDLNTGGGGSVSTVGGTIDGVGGGKLGLGSFFGGPGGGGSVTGGVNVGDVQRASLQEPLSTSGTAQVSSQGSGPGVGAAAGAAALGAGLGYAGAKAFNRAGKSSSQGRKHRSEGEHEAAVPVEGAEFVAAPEQPLADGATSGTGDLQQPPPSQQQAGATSSVAANEQHQVQSKAPQAQAFQQQAQAAAVPPGAVHPMGGAGGMGGMAGAAGAGGQSEEKEHAAASYLIQPDPDDVFGPTEAVTSGVIGADFEDDE